jgi:hypothetical protein
LKSRTERVQTLHPNPGKAGARIDRAKYEAMKHALLETVGKNSRGVAFGRLAELVSPKLPKEIFTADVSVSWYVTVVKLDLEARGVIERIPGARVQMLRST